MNKLNTAVVNYPLTLLYDGKCPICMLEMTQLMQRNAAGLLRFTDVSSPEFAANHAPQYAQRGAPMAALQAQIHAERPDGSFVIGVPVLVLAYEAVGLGRWVQPVTWPLLQPLVNLAYRLFARHRYSVSRVFSRAIYLIAAKRAVKTTSACLISTKNGTACGEESTTKNTTHRSKS
jgi:predicted DCC family thiol-disulfide oxidoreductase YuxK